jgi:hypothetical protein
LRHSSCVRHFHPFNGIDIFPYHASTSSGWIWVSNVKSTTIHFEWCAYASSKLWLMAWLMQFILVLPVQKNQVVYFIFSTFIGHNFHFQYIPNVFAPSQYLSHKSLNLRDSYSRFISVIKCNYGFDYPLAKAFYCSSQGETEWKELFISMHRIFVIAKMF